jgi:hypothetical protein
LSYVKSKLLRPGGPSGAAARQYPADPNHPTAERAAITVDPIAAASAENRAVAAVFPPSSSNNQLSLEAPSFSSSEQGVGTVGQLRAGDVLLFRGDYQQLQQHAERLGFVILTSDLTPLPDAVAAALEGPPPATAAAIAQNPALPPNSIGDGLTARQHLRDKLGLHCLTRMDDGFDDDRGGKGVDQGFMARQRNSLMLRKASAIGWSGASMWMFRVSDCFEHHTFSINHKIVTFVFILCILDGRVPACGSVPGE